MSKKFSYQTLGSTKAKNIIVFLHGWGGSGQSFETLSNRILERKKSLRLVLLDLPGFGDSTPPPREGWTTHQYAYHLEEFLTKELKISETQKVHLYGHSFGCRVIIRYLLHNTEFAGKIFLTGAAGIKWPPTFKTRCTKFLSKLLWPVKVLLPGKLRKKLLRRLGAGDWADMKPELKHTFQKVLKEEDLRIHLAKIYQQIYLIWGRKDSYTPLKSAEVFHRSLPNSRLKTFSDGKHGIHYTHIDTISKVVVEFVTEK